MNGLDNLYTQYAKKYPTLKKEAVINIMLQDGVISTSDAKKLHEGSSIFNIKSFFSLDNDSTATEIWGGHFSQKEPVETSKEPLSKPHEATSLVEVNKKGEIYNSQFTIEGIRKKYKEPDYTVTKETSQGGADRVGSAGLWYRSS